MASPEKFAQVKQAVKEHWRDRDARLARERAAAAVGEGQLRARLVAELAGLDVFDPGGCNQFRADGRSPWELTEDHGGAFTPFNASKDATQTLEWFFGDPDKSPEEKAQLWVSGKPSGMFGVSTGPNRDDNQGASNAQWHYAIVLDGGELDPGGFGFTPSLAKPGPGAPVRLLSGGGNPVVTGGRLGECIWVGGVPNGAVKGYVRAGGHEWERVWRPFTPPVLARHKAILEKPEYSVLFLWEQLYHSAR